MVEIVYRGLQSGLVSNPVDIPLNEPNAKPHCEENRYKTNTVHHSNPDNNQSGWNLVEALSSVSNVSKDKERSSKSYNYAVGTSSVRLSPKSLELCTENLGNETGSDEMIENEVELFSYSSSWENGEKKKGSGMIGGEKEKRREIPPPLSTIRGGSDCLRMMAHREDGRLVIQVTKLQPTASCFRAERSHGRLRLSFLTNPIEEEEQEEEEEEEEEENERETSGNSWNIGGGIAIMQKYDTKGTTRCKQGGFGIAVINFLTA